MNEIYTTQTNVRKWGNSHGIRLPKEVMSQMNLQEDDTIEINIRDGKMIIEKPGRSKYTNLKERLEAFYQKPIEEIYVESAPKINMVTFVDSIEDTSLNIDPCNSCDKSYSSDCTKVCYYGQLIEEKHLLESELDVEITTIESLATIFCTMIECKNCPVVIYDYDKRTKYEKEMLHTPCCTNLYSWIIENALDVNSK